MKKHILACLLAAVMLCGILCGCGDQQKATVSVQSVGLITGMGSVGLMDSYAGMVTAGDTVKVDKDGEMKIQELLISAGDNVKEGQVLFTYDTEAISLELDKMQLELEQMQAAVETKTQQLEELEKEKAKAKQDEQLDYTLQIQELQIDITETGLNLKAKEREIEQTKKYLENDKVKAPIEGRVQSINENGGYDDMGNPLPYITISQTSVFRIKGTINEQNAAALMIGMPVTVRSRVDRSQTWTGSVEQIDWDNPVQNNNDYYWGGDEMTQSSKYPFYVALDSDEGLMLGQHVYIEPGEGQGEADALALPSWCIVDAETENPWVWAVNDREKLEKRSLKLGEYDPMTDTYPVLEGLTADDYIAPPGEDCEEGAAVVYYSESDFEPPVHNGEMGFEEGGFEEGGFSFEEGGFEEGGFGFEEDGFENDGDGFHEDDIPEQIETEEGSVG